jgi:glycosyltransferase involved in cell wall biosynthesis
MNVPDPRLFAKASTTDPSVKKGLPGKPSRGYKIVHHGTLVQRYGADIAVRAFADVRHAMPEAHFFIYGTGDFRPTLEAEVVSLGLGDSVHISDGALPLDDVPSALSDANVGVVPHRDGPIMKWALPTKMMEYIALGIPVVVAKTQVIAEYFDDSMVMFFEPGNVSDLARCILKLYREPEVGQTLARNAAKFLEEHSCDKEKLKLCSLIDSLTT